MQESQCTFPKGANAFYKLANPVQDGPYAPSTLLDMLKQYSFGFYEVITRIARLRYEGSLATSAMYTGRWEASEAAVRDFTANLSAMRAECDKLDLTSTTAHILHIESEVSRKGKEYSNGDMLNHLDSLGASFAAELRRESCFLITQEKNKYFQKNDSFGPEVSKAFGSCADEIRNAGNCYALEQNDACVFHLMRVLERGLNALAIKFEVSWEHSNWHNIIEQIESKISKMNSSYGQDWKNQEKFYSEAALHFRFFKNAWRNHVMHARDYYDEGTASSILTNVREFMQALAKGGLSERLP